MIPIKRNHFYTKEIVSNAVGVRPQFKDLSVGNAETTLTFKAGLGATQWVVSGSVSETPFPNMGELRGGFLQTYVTGMSLSGTTQLPSLYAYKLQNGFPIQEGSFTIGTGTTEIRKTGVTATTATVGDQFWISSTQLDSGEVWLEESFDGSNKSMGSKLVLPGGGNAAMTMEDAYVIPKEGAEAISFGGDAFFGGGASNSIQHNLRKYYSVGGPSGTTTEDQRVYVKPKSRNRKNGLWTAMHDHRDDKQKWQIYEPYWKWDKMRSILKFGKVDPVDGTLPEGEATPHNTIFNSIWKDNTTLSGWQNPAGNMLESTMTLVPSEDGGEGQSLRISSHWWVDPVPQNNRMSVMAKSAAIDYQTDPYDNNQFTDPVQHSWCSIHDIPYPIPQNIGGLAQTLDESGNRTHGDQRVVLPEININMKIAQLLSSPALDIGDSALFGTNGVAYGTVSGSDDQEGTSQYALSSYAYHNKTFWRSVVVTFSNYKPEEVAQNCTFDQFVKYGLDYAYGQKTTGIAVEGVDKASYTNRQLGPKIVTGLVFSAFYSSSGGSDDGAYDGFKNSHIDNDSIYAYTLPVAAFASGNTSNSIFGMWATTGGVSATFTNPPSTLLHCPIMGPLTGSSRKNMPYVKVPRNEFFNVKFVFDVQQPWSKDTSWGWYMEENNGGLPYKYQADSSSYSSGVPIRAYFDTVTPPILSGQTTVDSKKHPYINLALPAYNIQTTQPDYYMGWIETDGNNMQIEDTDDRRGTPEHFPKHMTIWVNNFTFAPVGDGSPPYWADQNTWFDDTYWVSDDEMYPPMKSDGTLAQTGNWKGPNPIATELLIDSIDFKYWNTPLTQNSAAAGITSRFVKGELNTIPTPVARVTVGADYGTGFSPDGHFNDIAPGQYITLGYKDWDWLPIVAGAGTGGTGNGSKNGYMLFNNFSSREFGIMQRATPDAAWISTVGTDQDGANSKFSGYSMYGDLEGSFSSVSGTASQNKFAKVFVTSGSTIAPETTFGGSGAWPGYVDGAYISMGYDGDGDWLSTDGLTQKGFMKLTLSSGNSSPAEDVPESATYGYAAPRENPLTSAKILSVSGSPPSLGTPDENPVANVVMVDEMDIFHEDLDDEYIIYRAGWYQDNDIIESGSDIGAPFTVATCVVTSGDATVTYPSTSLIKQGMSVSGAGIRDNTYIITGAGTSSTSLEMSKPATAGATVTLTFNAASRTALGYKHTVKLLKKDLQNQTIELVVTSGSSNIAVGILKADDDITDLCVGDNLSQLYISPKRYWLNMMFASEEWAGNRQYENVVMINETPATGSISTQLGSTYNEAQYSYDITNMTTKGMAAAPVRPWILGVDEVTSLILNEDYGYGSYDEEENTGGEASKTVPVLNTESYFDLRKMVDASSLGPTEEVSLIVGLNDEFNKKTITVVGDDTALDVSGSTYYRPQYVWEYYDELPAIKKFRIEPAFDVLSPDIDLYELSKQPINNLVFKWDESAEDIWYRHLIISPSGAIENKYHECSFWAPLNEYDVNWSNKWHKYYTTNTSGMTAKDLKPIRAVSTTKETYITQYQPVITGLSGYATWRNSNAPGLSMTDSGTCVTTGNYNELASAMYFDMSTGTASTEGDNPWSDAWSLVVHCNPNNQDAATTTKTQGMTVCGVAQMAGSFNSGSVGGPTVTLSQGNTTLPASGALGWSSWSTTGPAAPTTGGFDLLHVYMKDNKVYCQYNHEFQVVMNGYTGRPYGSTGQYEGMLLSSSTNYAFDGTEKLSITLIWDEALGSDVETSSSILNDAQFRMYINGQLEDSTSTSLGAAIAAPVQGPSPQGGLGRTNYSKFMIGAFDTDNGSMTGGVGPIISNITAGVGSAPSSITAPGYDNRVNGYHGIIEEIILYPYALYMLPNAGKYELVTRGIPDYTSTGATAVEKNYNARMFVYDYTNVRGKSTSQVASSSNVQWKVTGV